MSVVPVDLDTPISSKAMLPVFKRKIGLDGKISLMSGESQNDPVTLYVCTTCRRNNEPLEPKDQRSGAIMFRKVHEELEKQGVSTNEIELVGVECLSGCNRGCTAAVSAKDKWTFVVGDLDPAHHVDDIVTYAKQYGGDAEGLPRWRDRPEIIRKGVLARVPAFTATQKEAAE